MKVNIEFEQIDNGFIIIIDGNKHFCKNYPQIARIIMKYTDPTFIEKHYRNIRKREDGEWNKELWKDKVGSVQAKILEKLTIKPMTVRELTEELFPQFPERNKWDLYTNIYYTMPRLVLRGFIRNIKNKNAKQKRYELIKP